MADYEGQIVTGRVMPLASVKNPDEFRDELDAIYLLHAAKRSDYTADSDDRLANYRFASKMMGVPIETGMFGRMCEKVFRIHSVTKKGSLAVTDEPLTNDLRDIAILAILMILQQRGGEYGPKGTA